jgi:hypothetical protein
VFACEAAAARLAAKLGSSGLRKGLIQPAVAQSLSSLGLVPTRCRWGAQRPHAEDLFAVDLPTSQVPARDYLVGVLFSLTASASACTIRGLGLFPALLRLEKNAQRLEFKCVQFVEELLKWASPEAAHTVRFLIVRRNLSARRGRASNSGKSPKVEQQ